MVRKQSDDGATKSDIGSLDAKMEGFRTELKSDIAKLTGQVQSLDARTYRTMIEVVKTRESISAVKADLEKQIRDSEANVTGRLDSFLARFETIWRESAVFPKILDEHGGALQGHESRIQALEVRLS